MPIDMQKKMEYTHTALMNVKQAEIWNRIVSKMATESRNVKFPRVLDRGKHLAVTLCVQRRCKKLNFLPKFFYIECYIVRQEELTQPGICFYLRMEIYLYICITIYLYLCIRLT